jgi:hypothetical protein
MTITRTATPPAAAAGPGASGAEQARRPRFARQAKPTRRPRRACFDADGWTGWDADAEVA